MELMDLDPAIAASIYQPLQEGEIRLARIEPGHAQAPIVVELIHTHLASKSVYDAISYVWGDTNNLTPICCSGISTNVTLNLDWALRRVRLMDRPRLVWADALCIDQSDSEERSEQVALMGRIYSNARLVLACMGQAPDGRAQEVASLLIDVGSILARPGGIVPVRMLYQLNAKPYEDRRWEALGAIMTVPWFTRVWVLQEIGLAQNPRVLYGDSAFSYRDLMATIGWIRANAGDFALRIGITSLLVHTIWPDWSQDWAKTPNHNKLKLIDLLDHGALLHCQDPRDRIYAFLGHPLARHFGQLRPDYTKTKLEVFQEATVLLLRDAGIRALSSVEHDASTICDGTPTWVIRWDVGCTLNNIHVHPNTLFHADDGLSNDIHIQQNVLRLQGILVDVVDLVFEIALLSESMKIAFRGAHDGALYSMPGIVQLLQNARAAHVCATDRAGALAGTLCCESGMPEKVLPQTAWSDYLNSQRSPQLRYNQAQAQSFWANMAGNCCGRAFVVTKSGLYGLAPRIVTRGDLCCVVYGSAVPFALRPMSTTSDPSVGRLVGELYLYGMMHGEAVRLAKEGQLHERTFDII